MKLLKKRPVVLLALFCVLWFCGCGHIKSKDNVSYEKLSLGNQLFRSTEGKLKKLYENSKEFQWPKFTDLKPISLKKDYWRNRHKKRYSNKGSFTKDNIVWLLHSVQWPDEHSIVTSRMENEKILILKREAVENLRKLLQSHWIPKDIESQMIAVKNCKIDGHDSFLLRYKMNGAIFQYRITQFHVYLAFTSEEWGKGKPVPAKIREKLALLLNTSLDVHHSQNITNVGGSIYGWGDYDIHRDRSKTISWWSDGEVLIIIISRYYDSIDITQVAGGFFPNSFKNWFTQKYKPGTNILMIKPVEENK